jgi:uncharacterized protein
MYNRSISLNEHLQLESLFVLGPRQTGKTTWLRESMSDSIHYNLLEPQYRLKAIEFPIQFAEEVRFALLRDPKKRIVVDEVQKIPALLDPIQDLIVRFPDARFLLTGSSARKLRQAGTNLLGGRAGLLRFHPLTLRECQTWEGHERSWKQLLTCGGLPRALLATDADRILSSYVDVYLTEEIAAEALVRNAPEFAGFLRTAAAANTQQIVFESFASDTQMSSKSVRNWFQILEDTLVGELLKPFAHTKLRKPVSSSKFYFFDCGVANKLRGASLEAMHSVDFGIALENLIYMELKAQINTFRRNHRLFYWRSQSQVEVDFIVTDQNERPLVAIEVKSSDRINADSTKGLQRFAEEFPEVRKIIVFTGKQPRQREDGIEAWPVEEFLMSIGEIF